MSSMSKRANKRLRKDAKSQMREEAYIPGPWDGLIEASENMLYKMIFYGYMPKFVQVYPPQETLEGETS